MTTVPRFAIVEARAYERDVAFRLPFRFGAATVTHAPQAFAHVRIRLTDGREADGMSAELMMPKWFDKSPEKSPDRNVDDLRASVGAAIAAYTSDAQPASAFGHTVRHCASLQAEGATFGMPALGAGYGGALVDRALLDALCRVLGLSFANAIRANASGIDDSLAPDLQDFDIGAFLQALAMPVAISVRHTVGLVDPLTGPEASDDGLPRTLAEVIARYGHRYFKLKLSGDPAADIARLSAIAEVLDALPGYAVTLDGNEQFADGAAVEEFFDRYARTPQLCRLAAATLYLEQPLPRDATLSTAAPGGGRWPLLIDESDGTFDAWPAAHAAGYLGASSKSCKGIYKSLVNAMRCAQWNADARAPRCFVSGEDLTTQAGLALQQDLALAAILRTGHVERNGHHYVDGFSGQSAPQAERDAFLAAHPDLYSRHGNNVRIAIRDGAMSLASLDGVGFAAAARPDVQRMSPLRPSKRPEFVCNE